MPIAFDVSEVVAAADRFHAAADDIAMSPEMFGQWADKVADRMRREVPVDEGDMRRSITVEREGLTARIGPTNTDPRGRPIGFFVNYGAGSRPPDDFIGRTAAFARKVDVGDIDIGSVL